MRFNNLLNKKIGRLTMTKFLGKNDKGLFIWECKCDCGNTIIAPTRELTREHIKSCGCLKSTYKYKHGLSKHQIYDCWIAMKARCLNPKNPNFSRYGGRGITICEEWLGENGFINFYNWAIKNGYDENVPKGQCTIDRIDVNGNYEPSNCRWVDLKTQARNKRNNHIIEVNNEKLSLVEFAEKYNLNYNTLSTNIHRNKNILNMIKENNNGYSE